MFYLKIARTNLNKNRRTYVPFYFAMIFLVVIIYNEGMNTLPSAGSARMLFGFGSVVIFIFSAIFSVYANSFLLKQRKKELGLYNILGLGKWELSQVIFWESVLSYLIVMFLGLLSGSIFGKLSFLVFKKMTGMGSDFVYQFPFQSIFFLFAFFGGLFLLLLLINLVQIYRVNPIDLLKGGQQGEKEPKSKWIQGLLGIVCLLLGYGISLSIQSPLTAINLFFIAVMLVIIGTYSLFTATSIVVLKMLKKNKKYYYQPNHFISLSSMIYRMKQNAAGLASICVLSTMVLVTLATTGSLYFGGENVLKNRNPFDLGVMVMEEEETISEKLQGLAVENEIEITERGKIRMSPGFMMIQEGHSFESVDMNAQPVYQQMDQLSMMVLMSVAEYNQAMNTEIQLSEDQVLIYDGEEKFTSSEIQLGEQVYQVKEEVTQAPLVPTMDLLVSTYFVVMASEEIVLDNLSKLVPYEEPAFYQMESTFYVNYEGEKKNRLAYSIAFKKYMADNFTDYSFVSKDIDREDMQMFMGGFLFLGMIFGLTFTLATGIILYYKQVSEGIQDEVRFDIMQRVGMSHEEVRKIIRSQILAVFFFPIGLASLHLAFAFPIIQKLLLLFGLSNQNLFLLVSLVVIGIFFFIYLLLFFQTSKAYYRMVERKQGVQRIF